MKRINNCRKNWGFLGYLNNTSLITLVVLIGAGFAQNASANCVRNVSSYVRVRAEPNTNKAAVGKIYKSQPFPYINGTTSGQSISGNNTWFQITYNQNTRRYVHSSKVARTTPDGITPDNATVKLRSSSSYLNVRSGPGTCYSKRGSIRHGTVVGITGLTPQFYDYEPQGVWAEVQDINSGRYIGYVANRFLRY